MFLKLFKGLAVIITVIVIIFTVILIRLKLNISGITKETVDRPVIYRDVVYKTVDEQRLKLDIYMPQKNIFKKAPVLFLYHGGAWDSGGKSIKQFGPIDNITKLGFAIVSVEYRLTDDETKFPAHIEDCADSVRYIEKNAEKYGFDINRFCVMGASAGGHLALLLALNGENYAVDQKDVGLSLPVKCVISLCSPTDLLNLKGFTEKDTDYLDTKLKAFIGGSPNEKYDLYAEASPVTHVRSDAPPVFMAHGDKDKTILFSQAETFYKAAKAIGMKVTFVPVHNADHEFQAVDGEMSPTIDKLFIRIIIFVFWHLLVC